MTDINSAVDEIMGQIQEFADAVESAVFLVYEGKIRESEEMDLEADNQLGRIKNMILQLISIAKMETLQ
jgi:hypothetical protein